MTFSKISENINKEKNPHYNLVVVKDKATDSRSSRSEQVVHNGRQESKMISVLLPISSFYLELELILFGQIKS